MLCSICLILYGFFYLLNDLYNPSICFMVFGSSLNIGGGIESPNVFNSVLSYLFMLLVSYGFLLYSVLFMDGPYMMRGVWFPPYILCGAWIIPITKFSLYTVRFINGPKYYLVDGFNLHAGRIMDFPRMLYDV